MIKAIAASDAPAKRRSSQCGKPQSGLLDLQAPIDRRQQTYRIMASGARRASVPALRFVANASPEHDKDLVMPPPGGRYDKNGSGRRPA
ncbi:MAG TPA: hypothetical protein VK281_14610, partial [Xanthobacteraceae bacterium]|nr:hypothetical protein [Xanthobacteraceae bacterium]